MIPARGPFLFVGREMRGGWVAHARGAKAFRPSAGHCGLLCSRPTPTYLKLLKGNPGKRRLNKNEPVPRIPASAPEPPAFLSDIAKEEWARVSGELYAMHLLTTVDVAALALYCDAYSRWRTATEAIVAMAGAERRGGGSQRRD